MSVPFDDVSLRTARLCVRLSPAALTRLREAAELRQQDLTSFVLGAALEHANAVVAGEQRTHRNAPPADDDPAPVVVRDPDDPDDDLWDDYRVTREPPELQALVFEALQLQRRQAREAGLPVAPVEPGWG